MYNFSDPNVTLSYWIDLFLNVINKRGPLEKKREKYQTLLPWLNTGIKQAMLLKDKCRQQKKFVEYKQQRNRKLTCQLPCEGSQDCFCFFNDLAGNKAAISSMWRTINTLTLHVENYQHTHSPANNDLPSELTLQKIKSIKNQYKLLFSFLFYFIKSHTCDSFVNHFDGHFA